MCDVEDVLCTLHGTRAGDDIDLVAAEPNAVLQLNDRIRITPLTRNLLVRLGNGDDLEHAEQSLYPGGVDASVVPHEAHRRPLPSFHGARFVAQPLDLVHDGLHLGLGGAVFHHDQHVSITLRILGDRSRPLHHSVGEKVYAADPPTWSAS